MIQNLNLVLPSLGNQESQISAKAAAVSRVYLPWAHSPNWAVAVQERLLLDAMRLISLEVAVLLHLLSHTGKIAILNLVQR